MKEKFQKVVDSRFGVGCDRFCNSVCYIAVIGAVCILCHSFDIPVVGAALLTLLLLPALLFCKNSFVLMPFVMMCSFVISEDTMPQSGYYNTPLNMTLLCIMLGMLVLAFAFNIVYFDKWKYIFKRAYLTVSLVILTFGLLMGGVGSPSFSGTGFGTALAIALTMFMPYTMIVNCGEYNGRKTVEYFAYAMIAVAVVIFAAVIKQYIKYDLDMSYHPKDLIVFGYAISNTGAAFVVIALPITFYLVHIYKHGYLFLIAVALEIITIVLTFSRASILVTVFGSLIVATAMVFTKKSGVLWYRIAYVVCLTVALTIVIVYWDHIYVKIQSLLAGEVTDSGRSDLWSAGFAAWKQYPVLGVGIWYLPPQNSWYYSFHCTPLTYLYCTGVVGLAAYVYHRYKTVRLVFKAKLTDERIFVALCVLAMVMNALLDIGMTSPPHLLYYGILLGIIECDVNMVRSKVDATVAPVVPKTGDGVIEKQANADNNSEETKHELQP